MDNLNNCCIVCGEPLGEDNVYSYCSLECKFNGSEEKKEDI